MIYKIVDGKNIFELNPGLRAIAEFNDLEKFGGEYGARHMTYVCLVCDPSYDNPIRTLPPDRKLEKAAEIAGYPLEEGKRLNKNGRELISGKVQRVEKAILKFRELHYNEDQETLDSLTNQIAEIRTFLKSPKTTPLTNRNKIVLDDEGKEVMVINPKMLLDAVALGEKLPSLIEAKKKIESLLMITPAQKLEVQTYTANDINNPDGELSELSVIDQLNQSKRKNG